VATWINDKRGALKSATVEEYKQSAKLFIAFLGIVPTRAFGKSASETLSAFVTGSRRAVHPLQ